MSNFQVLGVDSVVSVSPDLHGLASAVQRAAELFSSDLVRMVAQASQAMERSADALAHAHVSSDISLRMPDASIASRTAISIVESFERMALRDTNVKREALRNAVKTVDELERQLNWLVGKIGLGIILVCLAPLTFASAFLILVLHFVGVDIRWLVAFAFIFAVAAYAIRNYGQQIAELCSIKDESHRTPKSERPSPQVGMSQETRA